MLYGCLSFPSLVVMMFLYRFCRIGFTVAPSLVEKVDEWHACLEELRGKGRKWRRHLAELLAERSKLSPFMPVLPHCYRLLHQDARSTAIHQPSKLAFWS
ncbi:unnamed protein product [Cuscuta campestris]|uniref:Uncharacterized protein n=1 Tax=Cuscuta campestris TaxID=132261 RepID=A0A484NA34_9ASTE|nr:unnamed protein product [Cuscuta campestris]